ncbi:MAG: glycosyltransferase [Lachnospiraceae bacterium]|nr:glycosyltransferase [Lachnospiraceae bacterium]
MSVKRFDRTISVIIPIYNIKDYIERCLSSVINQSYTNLEILAVDDGSPDESGLIAEEFAKKDSRIRVIHRENGGLSEARNAGLNCATGDYIFFLDGDDWLDRHALENLVRIASVHSADIVACGISKVWEDGREERWTSEAPGIWDGKESILQMIKSVNVCSVAWNKLYRAGLWNGISFPEGCLHEDEYTIYKLLYKSQKVVYIPDAYYKYLQRDSGIMGGAVSERGDDYLEALRNRMDFFEANGERKLHDASLLQYLEYLKYLYRESDDEYKRKIWSNEYNSKVGFGTNFSKIPIKKRLALILWKYIKYSPRK